MAYKFLNIGGGNFDHRDEGWANLDTAIWGLDSSYIDVSHNLMSNDPLPIKDCTYNIVYSSHTIEHLTDERANNVFKEVYRILVPKGIFRLCVPDSYLLYDYLVNPQNHKLKLSDIWIAKIQNNTNCKIFLDAVCTYLISKISDKKLEKMYKTKSREMFFSELQKYVPNVSVQNSGWHLSWWHSNKINEALCNAGFCAISKPLARNESSLPELRKPYIDNTYPDISIRIESTKQEKQ